MKSKSLILLAVSLGFGLVAAIGISQSMGRSGRTTEKKQEFVPVMVALEDIEVNGVLTEENCKIQQLAKSLYGDGKVDVVASFEEVENKRLNIRIRKGLPITKDDLVDEADIAKNSIEKGYKLSFVNLKSTDGFSNIIQPGNLVDVIGIFKNINGPKSSHTAKTFLKKIRVYSVDGKRRANYETDDEGKTSRRDVVIGLLVTEKQSEKLQLVAEKATIKLTLRGDNAVDYSDSEDDKADLASSGSTGMSMDEVYGITKKPTSQKRSFSSFLEGIGKSIRKSSASAQRNTIAGFKPFSMVVYTSEGPVTYRWDRPGGLPQRVEGYSPVRNTAPRPYSSSSAQSTKKQSTAKDDFDPEEYGKEFGGDEVEPGPDETGE